MGVACHFYTFRMLGKSNSLAFKELLVPPLLCSRLSKFHGSNDEIIE
jgi:hypothetical protein